MLTPTGTIRVVGTIVQRSVTLAFCEAKVFDENNKVCCLATGTFKYFKKMASRDENGVRVLKADQLSV
jgi:acyl-coenzyme A thioesterase PaaI-like protein